MHIAFLTFYILVILIHVYTVVLEMALWKTRGPKTFGITPEFARQSAGLASNQGLYNGFLVAALVLGLIWQDCESGHTFRLYGLGCVIVAGIWGAITVTPRIFLIQSVPAIIALALYLIEN